MGISTMYTEMLPPPTGHPHWKTTPSGRPWFAELHWQPPKSWKQGKLPFQVYGINEFNTEWKDPNLPDGESKIGYDAKDNSYMPVRGSKHFQPGPLDKWQKETYNAHPLIRKINDKWDISPQHPGIKIEPYVHAQGAVDPKYLGYDAMTPQFVGLLIRGGPKFWDAPVNEECHAKAFALARYSVGFSTVWWMMFHTMDQKYTVNQLISKYAKFIPYPALMGAMYAANLCMIADFRQKDDIKNGIYASVLIAGINAFKTASKLSLLTTMAGISAGYAVHWMSRTGEAGTVRQPFFNNPTMGEQWHPFHKDNFPEPKLGPYPGYKPGV